ncbi:hypothetical protein HPB49_018128 [Dermacentor silvarum]|uniref:Uncharacterized protein n=1 Tax=Dermacentor silvarum TaxID=543639 RepID=A0ACB8DKF5_DERSI|nr:hypothetical protein HPB49_018128 [Dermacentor silvarum]
MAPDEFASAQWEPVSQTRAAAASAKSLVLRLTSCLSILEHVAEPPLVSNCSAAVLRCRLDTAGPNIEVWWTFHGENASKLPNVVLEPPPSREARAVSTVVAPPATTPTVIAATSSATTTPSSTAAASAHNSTSVHNSTSSSNETVSGTEPPLTTAGGDVFSAEDAENVTTASPHATTTLPSGGGEAASSEVESSSSGEHQEEEEEKSAVWTLRLNCPTLEHAGSYACYALSRNASEFIYKKEASLDVYGVFPRVRGLAPSANRDGARSAERVRSRQNIAALGER